jgi:hypothetical protein
MALQGAVKQEGVGIAGNRHFIHTLSMCSERLTDSEDGLLLFEIDGVVLHRPFIVICVSKE